MLQICVSSVAELPAETFIGGEGDFIVKQNGFLSLSLSLSLSYLHTSKCQDVSKLSVQDLDTSVLVSWWPSQDSLG